MEFNNKEYIEIKVKNRMYKISKYCPHRWGSLQYGHINENMKTITCPLHSSVFSLDTGDQLSGPRCGRIDVTEVV